MFLTSKNLSGISHGFFTRKGGVSDGIFASLNCGFGSADDKERVRENRARIAAALGATPEHLLSVYQVHGTEVAVVREPWLHADRPHADAMVTDKAGLAIGILTADCVPVLFADAKAGIIGAAHAGWRGALAGAVASTVASMESLGAKRENICVAIGPAIAQGSYEVGKQLHDAFLAKAPDNQKYFIAASADHWRFDLKGFVRDAAKTAGVTDVAVLENDTYLEEEAFFSYRRTTHKGEPDYGRQMSVIMLKD